MYAYFISWYKILNECKWSIFVSKYNYNQYYSLTFNNYKLHHKDETIVRKYPKLYKILNR